MRRVSLPFVNSRNGAESDRHCSRAPQPIATALLTEDQRIARVNAACAQLLGHDAGELVGRAAAELARPDPVPRRRSGDTTSGPHDQYEIHFRRPDGQQVWGRGDEFVLISYPVPTPAAAVSLAGRVMRTVQQPFQLGGGPMARRFPSAPRSPPPTTPPTRCWPTRTAPCTRPWRPAAADGAGRERIGVHGRLHRQVSDGLPQ
jgi:PAS domain